ncbi:hypothetical protein J6590_054453 [Homalodisca vitripennis]|nr:hypothetical protein J6590_054453 [Homalodisca vitripennis]
MNKKALFNLVPPLERTRNSSRDLRPQQSAPDPELQLDSLDMLECPRRRTVLFLGVPLSLIYPLTPLIDRPGQFLHVAESGRYNATLAGLPRRQGRSAISPQIGASWKKKRNNRCNYSRGPWLVAMVKVHPYTEHNGRAKVEGHSCLRE